MADDDPRDVRDTLSELERRLLDLERELRADAAQDAVTSGPGAPVPPAGVATAPPMPETPVAASPGTGAPAPPAPGVTALADDARIRVHALRDSLDGLVGASDRLRETAQTVVEDHGRALVRLDRVSSAHAAAQAPETPPPAEPPPEPAAADTSAGGQGGGGIGRRGALLLAGAGLLVAGLLAGLVGGLAVGGGKITTTTTRSAAAQPFLVMSGTPDLGVPAPRRAASSQAALAALCAGRAPAALIVTPDGFTPPCSDVFPVAHETLSARALAIPIPRGGRGRRCVSLGAVGALVRLREDAALTARRRARVAQAQRAAAAAARLDALPPAGIVRASRTAQATAGASFDRTRRLRLLGVSAQPGGTCVSPAQGALRSGGYPLSNRLTLVATTASAASPAVVAVRDAMSSALGGAVPVAATVLR